AAEEGTEAAVRRASVSLSASSTAFVISSTNRGMPSVRSMMSCRMLTGMDLLPTIVDHRFDIARRQPIDGEDRHVWPSYPGRREFRPEVHDQHHAKGPNPVHRLTKHFQARGVDPMHILKDHQHRTRT